MVKDLPDRGSYRPKWMLRGFCLGFLIFPFGYFFSSTRIIEKKVFIHDDIICSIACKPTPQLCVMPEDIPPCITKEGPCNTAK